MYVSDTNQETGLTPQFRLANVKFVECRTNRLVIYPQYVYITLLNNSGNTNMQTLEQEIAQAEAKIAELRLKLDQKRTEERTQAIASIEDLLKRHDLTINDLGSGYKKRKPVTKSLRADKGVPVAPKYKDPATGSTWTGRGRAPVWLATLIAAGQSKDDYLISKSK